VSTGRRVSRYSPLLKTYDVSRSPSVISPLNTNINEELRQKLDLEGITDKLAKEYEDILTGNEKLFHDYLKSFEDRLSRMKSLPQRALLETMEGHTLQEDQRHFDKKTQMFKEWVGDNRKKIEDCEMIYRNLYKHANNPKQLGLFFTRKSAELEADNAREENYWKRRMEILTKELQETEAETKRVEALLKEKETEWVRYDHQNTLAREREARQEMNSHSYKLILKYFDLYSNDPSFARAGAKVRELVSLREFHKKEYEDALLFNDEQKLKEEIARLQTVVEAAEAGKNRAYLRH